MEKNKKLMFGLWTEEEWKDFVKSKQWKKELRHRSWVQPDKVPDHSLQLTIFEQPKEEE